MKENKVKRLIWADALRGLLILLVVLGHSLQFGEYENRLSWNIIYSFHMAAFFVVSGYVSYKEKFQLSSLKQKAIQLLLPFLMWTILAILLKGRDWHYMLTAVIRPDSSYWFVYVLFVIISIFIVVESVIQTSILRYKNISIDNKDVFLAIIILTLVGLMVITEFRWFGFQFVSFYFGFYVIGYWLRKYEIRFSIASLIVMGVCWFVLSLFWRMHAVPMSLSGITFLSDTLLNYTYRYITAFIGSVFFLGLAMRIFINPMSKIIQLLSYLGKVSLGLYIIHLFIGDPIYSFYRELLSSDTNFTFVLLDSVTRILISLILINIIQRVPIVRLLLLGKK